MWRRCRPHVLPVWELLSKQPQAQHSSSGPASSGPAGSSAPRAEAAAGLAGGGGSSADQTAQFIWLWPRLSHCCCYKGWLARNTTLASLVAAVSARPFALVVRRQSSSSAGGGGFTQLAGTAVTVFGQPVQFALTTADVIGDPSAASGPGSGPRGAGHRRGAVGRPGPGGGHRRAGSLTESGGGRKVAAVRTHSGRLEQPWAGTTLVMSPQPHSPRAPPP